MSRRTYSPRPCPHCQGCWEAMQDCDFCAATGNALCDECGPATGFAATVHTERGEMCVACDELYEKDAA